MSDRKGSTESDIAAARAQTESIRERLAARRQKRNNLIAAATQNALPLKNPDASAVAALLASGKLPKTLVSLTTPLASKSVTDASSSLKRADLAVKEENYVSSNEPPSEAPKVDPGTDSADLEILLSAVTAKERELKRVNEEIHALLSTPTVMYVHYEIDPADLTTAEAREAAGAYNRGQLRPDSLDRGKSNLALEKAVSATTSVPLYPPQWIKCDIRQFDMTILGKFAVIMADPPWDIHMELPYGTMSDDEMRKMDIPCLQDDGYIFLWVTGRAMELGRECLKLWGYERVDEVIWVKTNQLQRLIRTGRTGHWLNHGKEHCLVGVKGSPRCMNRGLDCDVVVSEVRETSRKPDEIYGLIERLSPGTRKLELFGRPHNLQANWITLGNQLDGTYLVDPEVVERYRRRYPNGIDNKDDAS
ncbi:N6-adenosine-methyltransferase subunit [Echinococcus granulosus]|uniref:mRNA m(6)A methyltransferase n=1 Tax=Echinococcus granulosus TaxID=6210 RepID=W6U710_ECHGR|nr:N6-adenosine-methyltransferase subunit [Echinococcus granulosus]EUB57018.1 N6-adenosine-methyltransferase subunit [Echinococcus granulosus]